MSVSTLQLRPITVTLDGQVTLPALVGEYRWNGWQCPYFRAEDVRAARGAWDAMFADADPRDTRYTWDAVAGLPSIVSVYDDDDDYEEVGTVTTVEGDTLVTIGWASWVWSEVD